MKKHLILGLILFINLYSFSQALFFNNYSNYLNSVIQSPDGGFIATGGGGLGLNVIKVNTNGQMVWSKLIGMDNSSNVYNTGNGIINTKDSGFAMSGGYKNNPAICKFDAKGNILWAKQYSFNARSAVSKVLQTSDGGYLLATSIFRNDSPTSFIIKTNAAGNVEWAKNYFTNRISQVTDLVKAEGNKYAFTTINSANTDLDGDTSFIVKINDKGDVIWCKNVFNTDWFVYAHNLISTNDSGFLITGHAFNNDWAGGFTAKLNRNGETKWSKATSAAAYLNAAVQTKDSNYIVYGNFLSTDSTSYYFSKINNSGIQQWSKTINSGGKGGTATNIFSLINTKDAGYFGVGWIQEDEPGVMIKLDSNFASCKPQGTYDGLFDFMNFKPATVDVADSVVMADTAIVETVSNGNITNDCQVLSVQLLSLNAIAGNNNVLLQWQTANETNSNYFDIERSADSKLFTSIGDIKALNTSKANYSFTDKIPLENYNYYRLKQVDKDGTYMYSTIASANFTSQANFALFPNPASNNVNITFPSSAKIAMIELYDMNGKNILSVKIDSLSSSKQLNIEKLIPGIYCIVLSGDKFKQTLRLIKN
jgi:Secretion system C-terminal sorting domain